ncbi:MAG: hypothetical protein HWD61_04670 [Parachlamydiaceae bacterium]|nr:MAG: hypothetical protein HWD61_04670 [Parachlamydiaceae bacterium]
MNYPVVDYMYVIYLTFAILSALLVTFASYIISYRVMNRPPSLSPYTKFPLRRAMDLSFDSKERVLRFLFNMHQYDNPMFDFEKAALCRETGRIFPNALTWYGTIKLDWTFCKNVILASMFRGAAYPMNKKKSFVYPITL